MHCNSQCGAVCGIEISNIKIPKSTWQTFFCVATVSVEGNEYVPKAVKSIKEEIKLTKGQSVCLPQ